MSLSCSTSFAEGACICRMRLWRAKFALLACIVNHQTTDDDIAAIVEDVLAAAQQTA